jgi:hypothetical protein
MSNPGELRSTGIKKCWVDNYRGESLLTDGEASVMYGGKEHPSSIWLLDAHEVCAPTRDTVYNIYSTEKHNVADHVKYHRKIGDYHVFKIDLSDPKSRIFV